MLYRKLVLGIAFGGLMTATALAQTAWVEIDDEVQVSAFNAKADDVDDWDVYNSEGVEIGEVEEVVGPDAGTPTALVVDFEGNAGYADRDVVIPIEEFSLEGRRLVLNATPETVSGFEVWKD